MILLEDTLSTAHVPGDLVPFAVAIPNAGPGRGPDSGSDSGPGTGAPAGPLPVVVALHGNRMDHRSVMRPDGLALPRFLAETLDAGTPAFAVAAIDGGSSYWHPHHGTDTGALVLEALLPWLAGKGLDTDRIGLLGWSMGGYGALRLASLLGPERVAAVAVTAPALWRSDSPDISPSGFDDADEYATYSVMHRHEQLDGIPVQVHCGDQDAFLPAVEEYVAGFAPEREPPVSLHVTPGGHDGEHWCSVLPSQLAFLGSRLAG